MRNGKVVPVLNTSFIESRQPSHLFSNNVLHSALGLNCMTMVVTHCFQIVGILLPKCTFPHCIQTIHCVILTRHNYHPMAIVWNLQATFHEDLHSMLFLTHFLVLLQYILLLKPALQYCAATTNFNCAFSIKKIGISSQKRHPNKTNNFKFLLLKNVVVKFIRHPKSKSKSHVYHVLIIGSHEICLSKAIFCMNVFFRV